MEVSHFARQFLMVSLAVRIAGIAGIAYVWITLSKWQLLARSARHMPGRTDLYGGFQILMSLVEPWKGCQIDVQG